ncbi:UNVERIFIED_CONTAM: hypothetical protein GTU68_027138 [Idotea baltica]|nr:hypothetical protein [Idotea baltica]
MLNVFQKLFGTKYDRDVKTYSPIVEVINKHFDSYKNISNDELRNKTLEFKDKISEHEVLKEILPEAFAVVKETGEITWNMLHYDVQLIGGMVLHDGKIAEMQTGEGKTLVATLPAYLNGLSGQGVHVITVNDYLARRDSEWIGPIFEFLLLTIDCIDKYRPHSPGRIKAYNCDITYGTNNEFGFDYLRDNMVRNENEKVQGKHHFTMVDEVDSVLIDDARTPLIISGPVPEGTEEQEYYALKPKIQRLYDVQKKQANEPLFFTIDEKNRNVELTEKGSEFLEKGLPAVQERETRESIISDYSIKSRRLHSVSQLLKAYTLFENNEEYVVMDGQVKIVDEQTGRMMEGRRYSDGLHQALEAKENVKVGDITQTYATVTLQNYFRMYHKLSGMTGTAETEASEFWEIYKLDVVVIPTNRPIIRDDREDLVFKTGREKFNAVIDEIESMTKKGRPVLVGTTSVDISERLSRMLQMKNIKHNVLNAKQHQREADIVAEAGKAGNVTIATNMAGRGTDIKISEEVKAAGGLGIIATERHDSRRVDRQLRGRAGRQGDPGSSQFFVSLEDNLMRLFHSERIAKVMDKMGHKDGEVIQHSMVTKSLERAQKKVEENNFGIRKRLLEYDDVMNIQREAIYKKRNNALSGNRIKVDLNNMFNSMAENIVADHKAAGNYDTFRNEVLTFLGFDPKIDAATFQEGNVDDVIVQLKGELHEYYDRKSEKITELLLPVIKNVYANEGHKYKRIAIPFTDGRTNPLPVSANLEDSVKSDGDSLMREVEMAVTLALIDENWKEHLRSMDELKESSQAASFEQKDPLVIYKMEAYELFENIVYNINKDVASYLMKGKVLLGNNQEMSEAKEQKTDLSNVRTSRAEQAARAAAEGVSRTQEKPETFVRTEKKVGRNDPCPCGSGKKYKQCHGKV